GGRGGRARRGGSGGALSGRSSRGRGWDEGRAVSARGTPSDRGTAPPDERRGAWLPRVSSPLAPPERAAAGSRAPPAAEASAVMRPTEVVASPPSDLGEADGLDCRSIACRMYAAGVWMPAAPVAFEIVAR